MIFEDRSKGRYADINFRPFCKGDGFAFRRCMEDFYGDGYPYREYLEEGFLLEKCESGKMLVLCAVTPEGEIVGTSAVCLEAEFKGSALLMLRVVKEAYRGMGIGKAQEDRLFQYVEQQQYLSVYADVMTHNCVSQCSLARRGFVYCGLRLMLYRNSVMVPGLELAKDGEMTQVIMCRRGGAIDAGVLRCPAEHAQKIRHIYQRLGAACRIDTDVILPSWEQTFFSWKSEELHHSCILTVQRVGMDFSGLLQGRMELLRGWADATALCYLNIKDIAANFAYGRLRQAGFFFTGLKPLQDGAEYMLLAYTAGQSVRFQDIHLSGEGEELLSYIREHRPCRKGERGIENN